VTITAPQPSPTNSTVGAFLFTSNDASATFSCTVDGAPFAPCFSPYSTLSLPDGTHTFSVKATGRLGNTSPAATATWTIDTVKPVATITANPAPLSTLASPQFSYTSNEAGSTFECRVDAESFGSCNTTPFAVGPRADGPHTFDVRAVDAAQNTGAAAHYAWTIDTQPPHVSLTSTPPTLTAALTARFVFSSSDTTATYRCTLDGGAATSCVTGITYNVTPGGHTFTVAGTDPAGNADQPVSFSWTVDRTPPETTITSSPPNISGPSVSFSFTSNESGSTFNCAVDSTTLVACEAPVSYPTLGAGQHTFRVAATDAVGNTDTSPATFTWTVDPAKGATLFMSPTGSDANDCATRATACQSFGTAFTHAVSGSIVELAGGTYSASPQAEFVIPNRDAAITSAVTFQPALGATVLLASNIDIESSHFHLTGIKSIGSADHSLGVDNSRVSLAVCENVCTSALTDVLVEGFSGKSVLVRSPGVTVKDAELGNYSPCANDPTQSVVTHNPFDAFRIVAGSGATATPSDIVVDSVRIHDVDDDRGSGSTPCPGATNGALNGQVHCLFAQGGTNVTIQSSRLWNCATAAIQARSVAGVPMANWTIQNNFVGPLLHGGNSVALGGGPLPASSCATIVLRYNTIGGTLPSAP